MLIAVKTVLTSLAGAMAELLLTLAGMFARRSGSGKATPQQVSGGAALSAPLPAKEPAVKPRLSLNFTQSPAATLLEFLFLTVFALLSRQQWVALAATAGMLLCAVFILKEARTSVEKK